MKKTIINAIFLLSFFPFFKLIPWIDAEVQPYGAFLGLICLMIFAVRKDRVSLLSVLFSLILLLDAVLSITSGRDAWSVITLSVAYALPLSMFLAVRDNTPLFSRRVFYASLSLYFVVGSLQSLGLLAWAEPYMRVLIPRAEGEPISIAGRGVTFLAQEPSGAGFIITLLMATGAYLYITDKISGRGLGMVTAAVLAMLLMNKSGTAFLLLFSFFSVFLFMMFWYGPPARKTATVFFVLPALLLAPAIAGYAVDCFARNVKFVVLLQSMADIVSSERLFSYASLAVLSGGRFLTVLMGYLSLSRGYGLGHGIAAYQTEYSHLSRFAGLDWTSYSISESYVSGEPHKPNAYAAQIALDMGAAGLAIVVLTVLYCWRQRGKERFWRDEGRTKKAFLWAIFATALVMVFFRSTTAMPVPWVMLAYVHDFIRGGIRKAEAINAKGGV